MVYTLLTLALQIITRINLVFKQLQQWKEAPVDCMVQALNYLQGYYVLEIIIFVLNFQAHYLQLCFYLMKKFTVLQKLFHRLRKTYFASLIKVYKRHFLPKMQIPLMMLAPQAQLYKVYLRKNVLNVY